MEFTKRQIEIMQAATKLIGDKGIQNLTTKNLAAEMKFSEPALYRHFKSKTQILVSVLGFYKEILQKGIQTILTKDSNSITKLEEIMKFQFNHFVNNPAIVMVIFAETSYQYDKTLSKTVLTILNQKKSMVELIVKSGQKDGSIRKDIDANFISSFYMGAMRFTILRWRLNDYDFDLKKEGAALWKATEKLIK
ncbi:MAG TPA: TetR/AcrR family transcriptional regulator [Crocinitomicaceae bacterium]|nr:TetR/AcrR family transcriptional regulator [Crocinitomicaceae bacterium]